MKKFLYAAIVTSFAWVVAVAAPAGAEVAEVRFARQLGFGYLQLYVMQEQKLVERQAAALGLTQLKATYVPLGSPAAINDALLSGSVDYGAAGLTPFIVLWDKTKRGPQVRGVAALNAQPAFLNTNKPGIKNLRDFTDTDRIAVPAVKLSLQAILLSMAAEQTFGPGQQDRLDKLTVSLAHPDGAAALLAGRTEITAHFTSPPFQYQELLDPKIHRVLSSYEITDGAATFSALWTTERFRADNPTVYSAVLAAVEEATALINANRADAARIFARIDGSSLDPAFLEQIIADPDIVYSTTPQGVIKFTDFLARTGGISNRPAKWQDLFFPDLHDRKGS